MKQVIRSFSAMFLSIAAISATAATDGVVGGASSEGEIGISLTVNEAIIVKNLSDIDFTVDGSTAAGTDLIGRDTFCVGGIGFTDYSIEFESGTAGADSGFKLVGSAPTVTMDYTVGFTTNTADTESGTAPAGDGVMPGSFSLDGDLACAATDTVADNNAQVVVTIPSDQWEAAAESSYSDTLYVTVTGQ